MNSKAPSALKVQLSLLFANILLKGESNKMMTELLASAILSSSITGAGLILAVFSIFIPISNFFMKTRKRQATESLNELKKQVSVAKKGKSMTDEKIAQLKILLEQVEEKTNLPLFLTKLLPLGAFFLYCLAALSAYSWLADKQFMYLDLAAWSFFLATIIFLFVGLSALNNIIEHISKPAERHF